MQCHAADSTENETDVDKFTLTIRLRLDSERNVKKFKHYRQFSSSIQAAIYHIDRTSL